MGIPSGLGAQLMTAEETTYGTPVTPDRAYEFRGSGPASREIERIESQALRAGTRALRSDRWAAGRVDVKGDVVLEAATKSQGRWWKHALGAVATTQPDAGGAPLVYKHTFTPGDLPVGQTVQVGRPDITGTAQPFTYHGCKVTSWELSCAVGELAVLKCSLVGEDEDTTTALAAASYPANLALYSFVQATLTVGGSAQEVSSATIGGDNGLNTGRYFWGSPLRKQPLEAGLRPYTGKLDTEFAGYTAYQRFVTGTEAELVMLFQGATIQTTFKYELKVTANVRFDGQTPELNGTDIVAQPLPYKIADNGTTSIKVEYQTTDTLP